MFPNLNIIAITLRESYSASENGWSAILDDGDGFYASRSYHVRIVDRVGSGDAFAAGLVYALTSGRDSAASLEFATAAGCLKHSIPGDFALLSVEEVDSLLRKGGSGRVDR